MLEDQFIELIDPLLRAGGSVLEDGEEFREPPLAVLRYYRRSAFAEQDPGLRQGPERGGGRSAAGRYRRVQGGSFAIFDPAGDGCQWPFSPWKGW